MRLILILLTILNLTVVKCSAATITAADLDILKLFWEYAEQKQLAEMPTDQRISLIGEFFINRPYKSNTLNVTQKELPVINLRELDCVTLVENVLALAFLDEYNEKATNQFIENIIKLRYRNGEIIDYTSRLHYSTDWLYEMGKSHFLQDMTQTIGGVEHPRQVNFMSENYVKYPVLAKDRKLLSKIKSIETDINKRTYYYIAKEEIKNISDKIRDGDIILMTTNIKGLDTSHLGFAIRKNNQIYLLHASSTGKKVVLTKNPLKDYMSDIKSQTGIMVARVIKR